MQEIAFSQLCGFHPRQWAATAAADAHRYALFGGSRGPGKSYWLRWYLLRFILEQFGRGLRGVNVGLFCETYRELIDRQVGKIQVEFPPYLGEIRDSHIAGFGFYLRPEYGGGVLAFRNLDDPTKYQSAEFAAIGVDELTKTPERTFHVLRGSLRWPGLESTRFIAATNPDGRWADWVRTYWIERQFPPELDPMRDEFAFTPARPGDNPHLPASYWDELNSLPDALRRAWVDGDWYVTREGLVYADFGQDNITSDEPDPSVSFELGFDDGYIDPRAVLFIQRTSTRILVFDEIYESRKLEEETVKTVLERCVARTPSELAHKDTPEDWPGMTLSQASAWCRSNAVRLPEIAIGSTEANQLMRRFQLADIPARGGTHHVVDGVKLVRSLIKDGKGYRALQVHPRCRHLIDELTRGYVYSEGTKARDSEKPADGNDHACDAARYWCFMRARR